jgi:hypothetical protein
VSLVGWGVGCECGVDGKGGECWRGEKRREGSKVWCGVWSVVCCGAIHDIMLPVSHSFIHSFRHSVSIASCLDILTFFNFFASLNNNIIQHFKYFQSYFSVIEQRPNNYILLIHTKVHLMT